MDDGGTRDPRPDAVLERTVSKIAVVGTGAVGTTIAYTLMLRGLVRQLVLIDKAVHKADAEAMDLSHGAMFVPPVDIQRGTLEDCRGAAVVVVTAGAKQQPGQSRLDLASVNAAMYRGLIPDIAKVAPDAHLLIVSNPVDPLTEYALRLSGFPPERVIGSGTVLDTSRFRFLLGRYFGVSMSNVHAYILGEHGDSEVPVWSSAQIGNVPLMDVQLPGRPRLTAEAKREIVTGVREAAGRVIQAKGATNWAVGLAVTRIVRALLRDERVILSVSRRVDDYLGVSGISLSVPWVVGARGAEYCLSVPCDAGESTAFRRSADVIQGVLKRMAE